MKQRNKIQIGSTQGDVCESSDDLVEVLFGALQPNRKQKKRTKSFVLPLGSHASDMPVKA